ncbi:hypothetical protein HK096_005381 [Nowakowskiella sp. JEL0078]|nr:hypothetical protein HK096_005381 [Nowakowskiella sp. JEL0078]
MPDEQNVENKRRNENTHMIESEIIDFESSSSQHKRSKSEENDNSQEREARRRKNTEAARRSRQRKQQLLQQLELLVEKQELKKIELDEQIRLLEKEKQEWENRKPLLHATVEELERRLNGEHNLILKHKPHLKVELENLFV